MQNQFWLLWLLIVISVSSFAQNTVKITIQDSATHEPLAYTTIKYHSTYAVSDKSGVAILENMPFGKIQIQLAHVGCEPLSASLIVKGDTSYTLFLVHHVHSFDEVVTYAHHKEEEPSSVYHQLVQGKELMQKGNISLFDALSDLNGIRFITTGNNVAKPIIGGMHSNRVGIISGNLPLESQGWGIEHAPEIDPVASQNIEVIKGAATLMYGQSGVGGLVRLVPINLANENKLELSVFTTGRTNGKQLNSGIKLLLYADKWKIGHLVSVNHTESGDMNAANYVLSNTAFKNRNATYSIQKDFKQSFLQLKTGIVSTTSGILKASHVGNLTDLNLALKSDKPLIINDFTREIGAPYQQVLHQTFELCYQRKWQKNNTLTFILASQNNKRQEFENMFGKVKSSLDLRLQTYQSLITSDHHFGVLRLRNGISADRQENVYLGRYFIPNFTKQKYGAYTLATIEKTRWLAEAGARYDYAAITAFRNVNKMIIRNDFKFDAPSLSLSAWYKVNHDIKIHLNTALKSRFPSINEQFSDGVHFGTSALEIGDIDLKTEQSLSMNGTVIYNHNSLKLQVEPYFHRFSNYIYLRPSLDAQLTIRGAFPVFKYVQTDVHYAGVDAEARYVVYKQLITGIAYNFVQVKELQTKEFLYGIPPVKYAFFVSQNLVNFKKINVHYKLAAEHIGKQWRVNPNADFSNPPSAYWLLRGEFGIAPKESKIKFFVSVNNILNSAYRDYNSLYRYYADDLGRNISITFNYNIHKNHE